MMYNEGYAVIAITELAKPVEHFPEGINEAMNRQTTFEWSASNRKAASSPSGRAATTRSRRRSRPHAEASTRSDPGARRASCLRPFIPRRPRLP